MDPLTIGLLGSSALGFGSSIFNAASVAQSNKAALRHEQYLH